VIPDHTPISVHAVLSKVSNLIGIDYEDAAVAMSAVLEGLTNEILVEYRPDLLVELADQHRLEELPKRSAMPTDENPPSSTVPRSRGAKVWISGVVGGYDSAPDLLEVAIVTPTGDRGSTVWAQSEAVFPREEIRGWFERYPRNHGSG
jgi:hypothetical protein